MKLTCSTESNNHSEGIQHFSRHSNAEQLGLSALLEGTSTDYSPNWGIQTRDLSVTGPML